MQKAPFLTYLGAKQKNRTFPKVLFLPAFLSFKYHCDGLQRKSRFQATTVSDWRIHGQISMNLQDPAY